MTWSTTPTRKHIECIPLDTRGPKRLWDAPAGWVLRTRGADGGTRPLEFLCPVHGRFTVEVPRGEDPDAVACAAIVLDYARTERRRNAEGFIEDHVYRPSVPCGLSSPWSPSGFGIWASSGEVKS